MTPWVVTPGLVSLDKGKVIDNSRGVLYEWVFTPFELKLQYSAFLEMNDASHIPFLTNILCFAKIFDEHIETLPKVLYAEGVKIDLGDLDAVKL